MIIQINDNLSLNPFQVTSAQYLNGSWTVKTTSGETFRLTPKEYIKLDDYGFDVKLLIDRLSDGNSQMIKYAPASMDDAVKSPTPSHLSGIFPGTNATGYGTKITTIWKIPHLDRLYRVYATCFSNCASHWILANGEKLHIRD